jgi:hypothetical protein
MRILLLFLLCGCPQENPYKNVTPQKVKKQVEQIQQKEEKQNDELLEKAKE